MKGRVALLVGLLLTLVAVGCSPTTEAELSAINALVQHVSDSFSSGDVTGYAADFTDAGLLEDQDMSREEFLQLTSEEFGGLPVKVLEIAEPNIDGDRATVDVTLELGGTWISAYEFHLLKEEGSWRINESIEKYPLAVDLPAGVQPLAVDLLEFAFDYEAPSEPVQAFRLANIGEQDHEAVLFRLTEELSPGDLTELLLSSEGEPEGVEFVAATVVEAGDSATLLLTEPLAPAHYAFVCFFDDTADPGHIHLEKGMVSTFLIG